MFAKLLFFGRFLVIILREGMLPRYIPTIYRLQVSEFGRSQSLLSSDAVLKTCKEQQAIPLRVRLTLIS
jgi:hypothetical protein